MDCKNDKSSNKLICGKCESKRDIYNDQKRIEIKKEQLDNDNYYYFASRQNRREATRRKNKTSFFLNWLLLFFNIFSIQKWY